MRHLLTIAGNGREGSTPSYGTLVDKLIELGAIEIWAMNDASGGAVALFSSSNDLIEVDGSNFVYEEDFANFPNIKAIDASASSGSNSYLSTAAPATGLQTVGACSYFCIQSVFSSSASNSPSEGLAADGNVDLADHNQFTASFDAYENPSLRIGFQGANGEAATGGQFETKYFYKQLDVEAVVISTRDSGNNWLGFVNGEQALSTSTVAATGGSNCKFVVGRNTSQLSVSARPRKKYGLRAWFKDTVLTAADALELQLLAMDFQNRFVETPVLTTRAIPTSNGFVNLGLYQHCMQNSLTFNDNSSGLGIGDVFFVAQMGQSSATYSSTDTIIGAATTTHKGDIMRIEKTGATERTVTHG